jgi:hypothetical protein
MNRTSRSVRNESSGAFVDPRRFHACDAPAVVETKCRRNQAPSIRMLLAPICAVLMAVFCGNIWAQAGIDMGGVTGTVKDPSGALVAHAQCTLTNIDTGVSQKALTTSAGAYSFSLVHVGTYSLKVEAPGFK